MAFVWRVALPLMPVVVLTLPVGARAEYAHLAPWKAEPPGRAEGHLLLLLVRSVHLSPLWSWLVPLLWFMGPHGPRHQAQPVLPTELLKQKPFLGPLAALRVLSVGRLFLALGPLKVLGLVGRLCRLQLDERVAHVLARPSLLVNAEFLGHPLVHLLPFAGRLTWVRAGVVVHWLNRVPSPTVVEEV